MGLKKWGWLTVATVLCAMDIRADVGPPVKISVPPSNWIAASSGEEYAGVIEIYVGEAGQLDEFDLSGTGWAFHSLTPGGPIDVRGGEIIRLDYLATPTESRNPLLFSATFDGRPIRKQLDLSAESFERAGVPGTVVSVDALGRAAPFQPVLDRRVQSTAGGGQVLHLLGRLVYMRPRTVGGPQDLQIGVDGVWFEVMDDDSPAFDEAIYSGYTDVNGNFDVTLVWDDCDVLGCDAPDIYLRWETDTSVVNVQHTNILEDDFSWSTENSTIGDFGGTEVNFGTVMPADFTQHPPLHILTNVTRAHRFILQHSGIDLEEVDALWPDSGSGAFYNDFFEELHISANEQWVEGTIIHEYGHHLLDTEAKNVSPDYCNNFCDGGGCTAGTDCENEGHCLWCPETDHDAWNEGFPNWLGSAVIRSFPSTYPAQCAPNGMCINSMNNGTGCVPGGPAVCTTVTPLSINDPRYMLESLGTCCQDSQTHPAAITEGFLGALLVDMEDSTQDDHNGGTYNCAVAIPALDCTRDAMALGPDEILAVATQDDPVTPLEFINKFRARYPQHDQDLWSTATNVDFAYSFIPPAPLVIGQTQTCAMNIAGTSLSIHADGNGSALRYQWDRFGVDVADGAGISGARCSTLTLNPLTTAHAGVYRAEVLTCDLTSSVLSNPIRVSVFPTRGGDTNSGSWGRNDYGQLGRGVIDSTNFSGPNGFPAPMVALSGAVAISPGAESWHKLALKSDGTVWAWGANLYYGQLGADSNVVRWAETPFQVPGLHNIVQVAVGANHSMALTASGKVLIWGLYSLRGYSPAPTGPMVTEVPGLDCVVSIAAGSFFAVAVKSDGTVWTWGDNSEGQLGLGSFSFTQTPAQVPGISNATAVAAGGYHTLVLLDDGTVRAFGNNQQGQLGDGTFTRRPSPVMVQTLTDVAAVRAGLFHSLVILEDQTARAWGNNSGTLGTGNWDRSTTPIQPLDVGTVLDVEGGQYHTLFLRTDHTVWGTGWNVSGELGPRPNPDPYVPLPIAGLSNVSTIGAGLGTSFALAPGMGPVIARQPINMATLVGQPASFSVLAFGTATLTYHWRNDNGLLSDGGGISGANTATLTLDPATALMAGNYSVLVANSFGDAESLPGTLTLNCPNGDGNCDGMIDPVDTANLAGCLNGPGRPRPPICAPSEFGNFDVNNDADVDLRDAAVLQRCFAGEDFIDPACGQ